MTNSTDNQLASDLGIASSDWFASHRERWTALADAGWEFAHPGHHFEMVGIIMRRRMERAAFWINRRESLEANHRILLESCEAFHSANTEHTDASHETRT